MCDELDDTEENVKTRWAILVDTKQRRWLISQVNVNSQIGEYEQDMCNDQHDFRIGAFFDSNVDQILEAMTVIGGGNSIEITSTIADLLSGVGRSFAESEENLRRWLPENAK